MALTLTQVGPTERLGASMQKTYDVTFDSSYAASGGESLTPADVGFVQFFHVTARPTASGYVCRWASNKLAAFWVKTGTNTTGLPLAEVTSTTDLSAEVTRVTFTGT